MLKRRGFDWTQARAFLATAEAGSFSGGARALRLTQPTLSRQVAALEVDLGVTLFERIGNSLELTPTGLDLLEHVRAMAEGAERVMLTASGRAQAVEGRVTVTATDVMAIYILPAAFRRLREVAPGIDVDILATNAVQDLRRREADISVRHVRPSEPELVGQSFGETEAYIYAASDYLDAIGRPETPQALGEVAQFVHFGFGSYEELMPQYAAFGIPVTARNFSVGSQTPAVTWSLIRQGLGVGLMMACVGDRTPGVERVFPQLGPVTFPTWLVTHREVHTSKRIRIVYDVLAEVLSAELRKSGEALREGADGAAIGPRGL